MFTVIKQWILQFLEWRLEARLHELGQHKMRHHNSTSYPGAPFRIEISGSENTKRAGVTDLWAPGYEAGNIYTY